MCCAVQCCEAREQTGGEVEAEGKDRGGILTGNPFSNSAQWLPEVTKNGIASRSVMKNTGSRKTSFFLFCLFSPTSTATSINTCTKGVLKSNKGTIRMITTKNGIICQLSVSFVCFFPPPRNAPACSRRRLRRLRPTDLHSNSKPQSIKEKSITGENSVSKRKRERERDCKRNKTPPKNRFTKF